MQGGNDWSDVGAHNSTYMEHAMDGRGSRQMMVIDGVEGPAFDLIHTASPFGRHPIIGPKSMTYFAMRKGKLLRITQPLNNAAPPK